jgi:hypothetical protein
VLGALMLNKPWFWHNQALLLRLANTAYGRELLGIDHDLPDVVAVLPSSVTARVSGKSYVSRFYTYDRHSYLIQDRTSYVLEYSST